MTVFKLHVISCGHGDTLLLQMPKKKWALIDCHLPSDDARERFFQYADSLKVKRLDYVVLTHPDSDHFKGMRQVLERYVNDGRELGYFCTSCVSPTHVMKLLESSGLPDSDVKEYEALIRKVLELRDRELLKRRGLDDQSAPIRIVGKRSGFSIVAVGPDQDRLVSASDATLAHVRHTRLRVNECSIVLVVQYNTRFTSHRFFLPGDMEGDGLSSALKRWDNHTENVGAVRTFNLIKAPHHGSKNGHDPQLAARIARKDRGVVVISCGTSYGLPNRDVLTDYLNRGWRVFCTTPRARSSRFASALQATNRARLTSTAPSTYDLQVTASRFGRLTVTPDAARIKNHNLIAYQ